MSDLGELGLSSYEESAYRALLRRGRATASEVAAAGDVPKGRVYDVLNALAGRDVVRVHAASDPRRYEAVPPDIAVDRLLAERKRELDAERDRYERVAEAVSSDLAGTMPTAAQFWAIGVGDEDAVAGMHEQFDRADESLLSVVGPPYDAAAFEAYSREVDAYADLVAADIEVQLLTTPAILDSQPSEQLVDALDTAEDFAVRTAPGIHLSYDVLDGEEVYLSVPAPFEAGERVGGAVVRDENLAADLTDRFERVWADATPVDTAGDDA
jgi:sugar-specific transcriptional regulator TrmB